MAAGGKFFSLPSVALPFAGMFLCGIAAFFTSVTAGAKGERSVTMLLPFFAGGLNAALDTRRDLRVRSAQAAMLDGCATLSV
jgi:hypothetical protein